VLSEEYLRELDSKGYLARIKMLYTGTCVTTTADPVAGADFPYNIIRNFNLQDSAGGMLARLGGYNLHLAARYFAPLRRGSAAQSVDTEINDIDINTVATNQLRFGFDHWVETNPRDNLGLVPNQNAAFKYTLDVLHATEADVETTPANTVFALTLNPIYEYYTVPAPLRADGRPQEVAPPFAGIVRQQWDEMQTVPSAAENVYELQPGKVIRNLILVARTATGVRLAAGISRVKILYGDDTQLMDASGQEIRERAFQLHGIDTPAGVYPISFADDSGGYVGSDYRRDLVDTRALSRIQMLVTTIATVTQLFIVHDELIVPAGVSI
jgi:hypothetical protein